MRLKPLLKSLLSFDANTDTDGEYLIRSLYFDSPDRICVKEKEDGLEFRKKYRARCYNQKESNVKLEIKYRNKFQIWKNAINLTQDEYTHFLRYKQLPIKNDFTDELIFDFQKNFLHPVVIVQYTREVYVYPTSNVRITFDKYLSHNLTHTDLFQNTPSIHAHSKDKLILEIKYNHFLPPLIKKIFSKYLYSRSSISKYLICYRHSRHLYNPILDQENL